MAIPTEQKALVVQEGQKVKVEKIPVPKLTKDDEILVKVCHPRRHQINVKVEAAAQNPTDWKHVVFKFAGPGKVVGCDIAGTVVDGKDKSLIGKRVHDPNISVLITGCRMCSWRMGERQWRISGICQDRQSVDNSSPR